MIPLRDNIPHRRLPIVTVSLIIINVVVFLYQISLGEGLKSFVWLYGFVPAKLFMPVGVAAKVFPLFTSMFLHAGLLHLLGNMWFMWIFADNVEDRLGHFNFLVFYILCGMVASLAHTLFNYLCDEVY